MWCAIPPSYRGLPSPPERLTALSGRRGRRSATLRETPRHAWTGVSIDLFPQGNCGSPQTHRGEAVGAREVNRRRNGIANRSKFRPGSRAISAFRANQAHAPHDLLAARGWQSVRVPSNQRFRRQATQLHERCRRARLKSRCCCLLTIGLSLSGYHPLLAYPENNHDVRSH